MSCGRVIVSYSAQYSGGGGLDRIYGNLGTVRKVVMVGKEAATQVARF